MSGVGVDAQTRPGTDSDLAAKHHAFRIARVERYKAIQSQFRESQSAHHAMAIEHFPQQVVVAVVPYTPGAVVDPELVAVNQQIGSRDHATIPTVLRTSRQERLPVANSNEVLPILAIGELCLQRLLGTFQIGHVG